MKYELLADNCDPFMCANQFVLDKKKSNPTS